MAPRYGRNTSRGRSRTRRTSRGRSRSPIVRAIQDYVIQPALAAALGPAGGIGLGLGTAANRFIDSGVGTSPTRYRSRSTVRSTSMRSRSRSRSMTRTGSRKRSYGPSRMRGKKSKNGSKDNKTFEQISTCGLVATEEIHGTLDDNDCVYIIAQGMDVFRAVSYMSHALLRKLFWKAGLTITNVNSEIPSRSYSDASGWRVVLYGENLDTAVETTLATINSVDDSSIKTMSTSLTTQFLNYSSGYTTTPGTGNAANLNIPKRLALFNVSNTEPVFTCDLNLDEEICHYKSYCTLKVQNRSVAANGLSEADDVSNNPIQGYVYNFNKQPVMKIRGDAASLAPLPPAPTTIPENMIFNRIPVNVGVQLIQAAIDGVSPALREPPYKTMFSNCKSASRTYIQPGAIKTYSCSVKGKMSFLKLLQLFKVQYGTAGAPSDNFTTANNPFSHVMVALEDVINQNANRLTVAYECERKVGIYFTTSKKTGALGLFFQDEYDNAGT